MDAGGYKSGGGGVVRIPHERVCVCVLHAGFLLNTPAVVGS